MHVNVYNRQTGVLVAQQAVFSAFPGRNACENSLIAVNHSIIVENNYGNASVLNTLGPWLADKSKVCPPTLLSSVYTLFGTTVCQGG